MTIRVLPGVCAAFCLCEVAASAVPCFDDLEQHYEYDDNGYGWSQIPGVCTDEKSIPPSSRINGGSVDIRVSGEQAIVTETRYFWGPRSHGPPPTSCPHSIKNINIRTRVRTGGVVYETVQENGIFLVNLQRPAIPNEVLDVPSMQRGLKAGPFVEELGQDTIAGHACRRVSPKIAEAVSQQYCILLNAPDCLKVNYILPLEWIVKMPDGSIFVHGKTTSLRYGALGTVVPPGTIHSP